MTFIRRNMVFKCECQQYLYEILTINIILYARLQLHAKSRFKCINTFIRVFLCGILFLSSTTVFFSESRSVILRPQDAYCSGSPQIAKSTEFKSGLFGGQWWGFSSRISFLYFNISGVILVRWALPAFCMNKYSLCLASLFTSGIIFFNSTLS